MYPENGAVGPAGRGAGREGNDRENKAWRTNHSYKTQ